MGVISPMHAKLTVLAPIKKKQVKTAMIFNLQEIIRTEDQRYRIVVAIDTRSD